MSVASGKRTLELPALAKINLTLEVLGRRPDGYHEVKTVMQTVDLADRVTIAPDSGIVVDCSDSSLSGEANLAWKAAQTLAARNGVSAGARITIEKTIPSGMGLGGGSSDAAAALLGLNQLWELDLGKEELAGVAAEIGSDVAFFLNGGAALAEGRGEIISPLPALPNLPLLLVCPEETIERKTAVMFSRLTSGQYSDGGIGTRMVQVLMGGQAAVESLAGLTCNAFEDVARQVFPQLGTMWESLESVASHPVRLTGAGPAMFCLPSNEVEFKNASNALQPLGASVYLVNTAGPGGGLTTGAGGLHSI